MINNWESTGFRSWEIFWLYTAVWFHQLESSDKLYFRALRVEGHAVYHRNEKFSFLTESARVIPSDCRCDCIHWIKRHKRCETADEIFWASQSFCWWALNLMSGNQWKLLHQRSFHTKNALHSSISGNSVCRDIGSAHLYPGAHASLLAYFFQFKQTLLAGSAREMRQHNLMLSIWETFHFLLPQELLNTLATPDRVQRSALCCNRVLKRLFVRKKGCSFCPTLCQTPKNPRGQGAEQGGRLWVLQAEGCTSELMPH